MGRYAGNGMQPFQAYRPTKGRSGAAMQADLDRRHRRDAASMEAQREIAMLKSIWAPLCEQIEELEICGTPSTEILKMLSPNIRRAKELSQALEAERKRKT